MLLIFYLLQLSIIKGKKETDQLLCVMYSTVKPSSERRKESSFKKYFAFTNYHKI